MRKTAEEQLRAAGLLDRVPLSTLTWERVASTLRVVAGSLDARSAVYVDDFATLVETRFGEIGRPFTFEEEMLLADPLVAQAVLRAHSVVTKTIDRIAATREPTMTRSRSAGVGNEGFTIRSGERWWWYGFWIDAWYSAGGSPVVLQLPGVTDARSVPPLAGVPTPRRYRARTGEGFVLPMPMTQGVDLDDLAEQHAEIIQQTIVQWAVSGAPLPGQSAASARE